MCVAYVLQRIVIVDVFVIGRLHAVHFIIFLSLSSV